MSTPVKPENHDDSAFVLYMEGIWLVGEGDRVVGCVWTQCSTDEEVNQTGTVFFS